MFCDTYAQKYTTLLPQTILLIMTRPTACCAVLFFIRIYRQRRKSFPHKGVMGFIVLRYLCHKFVFWHFDLKIPARNIALKISKNARISAKFELENLQIFFFLSDTRAQRQKNTTQFFPGKYFVNDDSLYCTVLQRGEGACLSRIISETKRSKQGWQVNASSRYWPVFTMVKTGFHKLVFATYWQIWQKVKWYMGFCHLWRFVTLR